MMKVWIYENHIYKLWSNELNKVWSSQLYKQLLQLRKESLRKKIIILSRVYNEPIQRPASSWLVTLIGRALHRYRKVKSSNPVQTWIFFLGFLFATAKVACITAMIILYLILHSAVHIFHIIITLCFLLYLTRSSTEKWKNSLFT